LDKATNQKLRRCW